MRYRSVHLMVLCGIFMLASLARGAALADFRPVAVAPHLHSTFSDGAHPLVDVVRMVRDAGYDVAIMSDHDDICVEFPCLGGMGKSSQNSLLETGFVPYLQACTDAQRDVPGLTVIPGFEASPYYYLEGSPFGSRFVIHQWMKHLLVIGIEDPDVYKMMPMMAYHTSTFSPGYKNHGEAPYIEFTRAVHEAGGMAFWAHPAYDVETRTLFGHVSAEVQPYVDSLLDVPYSAGSAIRRWDSPLSRPGGVWDQAIHRYCAGERPLPPWAMVEIDYHRGDFTAIGTLTALLPGDATDIRAATVAAIRDGRYYISRAAPGHIALTACDLSDGENTITCGETLATAGEVTLTYRVRAAADISEVRVIRDGVVVHQGKDAAATVGPFTSPASGAFRLAVRLRDGKFLYTNPMFVRHAAATTHGE